MKYCPYCRNQLQDEQFQCDRCRRIVAQPFCYSCRAPIENLSMNFCTNCGMPFTLPFGLPDSDFPDGETGTDGQMNQQQAFIPAGGAQEGGYAVPDPGYAVQETAPYPVQPEQGTAPYPVQPGQETASYPVQPGQETAPYPVQPGQGTAPYPVQPEQEPSPSTDRTEAQRLPRPEQVQPAKQKAPAASGTGTKWVPLPEQPRTPKPQRDPAPVQTAGKHVSGTAAASEKGPKAVSRRITQEKTETESVSYLDYPPEEQDDGKAGKKEKNGKKEKQEKQEKPEKQEKQEEKEEKPEQSGRRKAIWIGGAAVLLLGIAAAVLFLFGRGSRQGDGRDNPTGTPAVSSETAGTAVPVPETTEEPAGIPEPAGTPIPTETLVPMAADAPVLTEEPTEEPTQVPTAEPTDEPTQAPTAEPTEAPTQVPTAEPTEEPTQVPTEEPTPVPTAEPTEEPTPVPTAEPTKEPTPVPTEEPTDTPAPAPAAEAGKEQRELQFPVLAKTTVKKVNVRAKAEANGRRLQYINDPGTIVTLQGRKTDKEGNIWYSIKLKDGKTGYISAKYLVLEETEGESSGEGWQQELEEQEARFPFRARTTIRKVIVRYQADSKARRSAYINKQGTEVTVLDETTDKKGIHWYRVKLANGITGYAQSNYFVPADQETE